MVCLYKYMFVCILVYSGTPLERSLDNVNLIINVLFSIPYESPPLFKGHISAAKGVALQEGFHCIVS